MFKEFCYYLYEIHTGKESDNAKFLSAIAGILFLQEMNIISLWGIINYIFKLVILKDSIIFMGVSIWLILTILDYLFIYKKRVEIIQKVENFSFKRKRTGEVLFVLYIIATLFTIYYVIYNLAPDN